MTSCAAAWQLTQQQQEPPSAATASTWHTWHGCSSWQQARALQPTRAAGQLAVLACLKPAAAAMQPLAVPVRRAACLTPPAPATQPLQRLLLLPQPGPCRAGMAQCGATTPRRSPSLGIIMCQLLLAAAAWPAVRAAAARAACPASAATSHASPPTRCWQRQQRRHQLPQKQLRRPLQQQQGRALIVQSWRNGAQRPCPPAAVRRQQPVSSSSSLCMHLPIRRSRLLLALHQHSCQRRQSPALQQQLAQHMRVCRPSAATRQQWYSRLALPGPVRVLLALVLLLVCGCQWCAASCCAALRCEGQRLGSWLLGAQSLSKVLGATGLGSWCMQLDDSCVFDAVNKGALCC